MMKRRMREVGDGRLGGLVMPLIVALFAAGCSDGTQPEIKPTSAHVRVEGTAPGALQLVVSTDFYEIQNALTFEYTQILESSDTFDITLPYDEVIPLTSLGSVVVQVSNPDLAPAQVRMRVNLDSGQDPYDRTATMSDGGRLRYVFSFFQLII